MGVSVCDKNRIYGSFGLLTIYFGLLAVFMYLQELFDDWIKGAFAITWVIIYFISGFILAIISTHKHDKAPFNYTWLNAQLLHFLVFIIIGYMFALERANHNLKMGKDEYKRDFIVLQCMMPIVVISICLNPLPKKKNQHKKMVITMLASLNAFDIMDMLVDFKHVKEMGMGYEFWFYAAVGVSIVLLAFPLGLDEEDDKDPEEGRIAKTLLSLIFTDISFLVLRALVMHDTDSIEFGLVFAFKSGLSAIINIYLLLCAWCNRNRNPNP